LNKVVWKKVPEGTAALIEGLHQKNFHVVTALTECAVAAALKDSSLQIVGSYVDSSLNWAVITSAQQEKFRSIADLGRSAVRVGISRYGSGSHLMPLILAKQEAWKNPPSFVVCNNFSGLRESVVSGTCDFFMWEWFMTKPYVEQGLLKFIGNVPTPWPSVCFLAKKEVIDNFKGELFFALTAIRQAALEFRSHGSDRKSDEQFAASVDKIVSQFSFQPQDAESWLKTIQYSKDGIVSVNTIETVSQALFEAGIVEHRVSDPSNVVCPTFLSSFGLHV
jgi:sulfonate transport system substrate-binding protein